MKCGVRSYQNQFIDHFYLFLFIALFYWTEKVYFKLRNIINFLLRTWYDCDYKLNYFFLSEPNYYVFQYRTRLTTFMVSIFNNLFWCRYRLFSTLIRQVKSLILLGAISSHKLLDSFVSLWPWFTYGVDNFFSPYFYFLEPRWSPKTNDNKIYGFVINDVGVHIYLMSYNVEMSAW